MTEIVMPILAQKFRASSRAKRREILDGLEVRLAPLNRGVIGLMIDNNSLERAFPVIRRVNEKARVAYLRRARAFLETNGRSYPNSFQAPFNHNPVHPEKEEGAWGSMLREAISAHL